MTWDIYGQRLRSGYCEVHPDTPEPYPCSICAWEQQRAEGQRLVEQQMEQAHWDEMLADWQEAEMTTSCAGLA